MQHDHFLNKYILNPPKESGGGGGLGGSAGKIYAMCGCQRAKYLLPCCCIRDSLKFKMHNDRVLRPQAANHCALF